MKKVFFLVAAFFAFVTCAKAQNSQSDFVQMQEKYAKHKRELVAQYILFKDSASAMGFWKIYDAYEAERKNLGAAFVGNLQNYANNYGTLTDPQADALVKKAGGINSGYEKLYADYYEKEKKVVGALTAAQWIQLESYLNSVIKVSILSQIPFIGEINRSEAGKTN